MRSVTMAFVLGVALLLGLGASVIPFSAARAQSDQDLKNAGKNPAEILTYGMSYGQQRFSPLKQINRQTIKRLVPAWSYSFANNTGEESQPLIKDGVM